MAALFTCGAMHAELINGAEFSVGDYTYKVLSTESRTVALKANNPALVNAVIPETVTYDEITYTVTETVERAFDGLKTLLTVDIPKTIVRFGKHSFNACSNLEKTIIHDVNAWVKIDFNNTSLANPGYQSHNLYLGDKLLEEVVITAPIEQINVLTFYQISTIKKIVLPETVKKIGKWGFYKCGVEEMNLPDALTSSEDYAFQYCGLKRVVMPPNYITMKNGTFAFCPNLEYVKLPDNMVTLPLNTFQSCNKLSEVVFNEGLQTIKKGAFVANRVTRYDFPKSLKKIENQACIDPICLEEITFGPNIEFIGYLAFYIQDATKEQFNITASPLKKITIENPTPPELQITQDKNGIDYNLAWNEDVYENAKLYVPKGAVEAYRQAKEWRKFKNILEIGSSGIDNLTAGEINISAAKGRICITGADMPYVEVYDLAGVKVFSGHANSVEPGAKGLFVVKCGGITTKVAL